MMKSFLLALLGLFFSTASANDFQAWQRADSPYLYKSDSKHREKHEPGDYESPRASKREQKIATFLYDLPLREVEAKTITAIITILAHTNEIKLLFKRSSIVRMGDSIYHIHPLRFLGHIFRDQDLHNCMRTIKRSYFKWSGFMDGLSERMDEEMARDNLVPYIEGFSAYIRREPEEVLHYIHKGDWKDLVTYLIKSRPIDS